LESHAVAGGDADVGVMEEPVRGYPGRRDTGLMMLVWQSGRESDRQTKETCRRSHPVVVGDQDAKIRPE